MATHGAQRHETSAPAAKSALGVLLAWFDGDRNAGKARRQLEATLRSGGDVVLDTTVLKVDKRHKASVHDPRRVIAGTLTPTLTWGVFGLLTGGVASLITSAVLGAVLGGYYAYHSVHHATGAQLKRLGAQLPAPSSALLTFTQTSDARRLVDAATQRGASAASVVVIGDDLTPRGFASSAEVQEGASPKADGHTLNLAELSRLSMILVRYPDASAAKRIASRIAALGSKDGAPDVELVAQTDRSGHTRISDPRFGSAALGKNNIAGWGGLGLVCGAIAGASGGGVIGLIGGGVVTGVIWGLFGLGAGALYGLWAGRVISARRLKPIRGLMPDNSSSLVAWADQPLSEAAIKAVATEGSRRLILGFEPTEAGAVLEAAG